MNGEVVLNKKNKFILLFIPVVLASIVLGFPQKTESCLTNSDCSCGEICSLFWCVTVTCCGYTWCSFGNDCIWNSEGSGPYVCYWEGRCHCEPDASGNKCELFSKTCMKGYCGAECETNSDCPVKTQTFSDYCDRYPSKKLIEYDNDCVKDETTKSCQRPCVDCTCGDCTISAPSTITHCCKGVCGAECNADGSGCPSGKVCDTNTCTCVECITDSDCPSDGWYETGASCCVGRKKGNEVEWRDYYCKSDHTCAYNAGTTGCSNYQCIKGSCGAECNQDGSGCPSGKVCDTSNCTCITPSPTCGNGTIDSGEQCERPNTTNNTYCSQSTTWCDYTNRKYCTRDSYGNCNSSCLCVEDSWNCGSSDDSNYCSNCNHCGDGVCNCGETSSSCPSDCGTTQSCSSACQSSGYASGTCRSIPAVFGTGADGPANFTSGTYTIDSDKNYTDMTVGPGATVIVNSGVKIKVQGKLTVSGTISADGKGGSGGSACGGGGANGANGQATDNVGGKGGDASSNGWGGYYGGGGGAQEYIYYRGIGGSYGGGGAGVICISGGGRGGAGGGVLTIYAYSLEIKPGGLITASGLDGSISAQSGAVAGGGGGRIYIFVGLGGFSNSGTLRAKGGNGKCKETFHAAGGGGGGFIKVTAATTTNLGSVDVSGGGKAECGYTAEAGAAGSATVEVDPSLAGCSAGEISIGQDNCSSGNVCCCIPNQPPNPPANLTQDIIPCVWGASPQVAPGLAIKLNWSYYDSDNDDQAEYEIFISDGTNSATTTKSGSTHSSSTYSYALNLNDFGDWKNTQCYYSIGYPPFGYGLCTSTTYYWKVRVKDSKGNWSDWSATKSFTTPSHAYPYPNFKWAPQKPTIGEIVQFCSISTGTCASIISQTEQSKCFNPAGNVVPCSSFNWTFQNGNPPSSNLQNPTTTFTLIASNRVTLTIKDSSNATCSTSTTIRSTYPLPKWREIAPTSFFQAEFLASLADSLKFIKINLANLFDKFILNEK